MPPERPKPPDAAKPATTRRGGPTPRPAATGNAKSVEIVAANKQARATIKAAKISKKAAIFCAVIAGAFGTAGAGTVAGIEAAVDDDSPPMIQVQPVPQPLAADPEQPCHEIYESGLDIAAKNPKLGRLIAKPGKSSKLPFDDVDLERCPLVEELIETEYGRSP